MTGWTGKPGINAPSWNEMRDLPFVVVPSGNNRTRGNPLHEAFRWIQVLESKFLYQIANK